MAHAGPIGQYCHTGHVCMATYGPQGQCHASIGMACKRLAIGMQAMHWALGMALGPMAQYQPLITAMVEHQGLRPLCGHWAIYMAKPKWLRIVWLSVVEEVVTIVVPVVEECVHKWC